MERQEPFAAGVPANDQADSPNDDAPTIRGYSTFVREFTVAGRTWRVLGPRHFERLIDDPRVAARFERDEYMPYWAEFWPASLLLAELVAAWPVQPTPAEAPSVLELGCGLGMISLVAAERGYRVVASDYDDDALAFVAENARLNGIRAPELRWIDWRESYEDLRVDRIIAAEVTYERRNLEPIAAFIAKHLRPNGHALLIDRNRQVANEFETVARHAHLNVETNPVKMPDRTAASDASESPPLMGRLFRLTHAG